MHVAERRAAAGGAARARPAARRPRRRRGRHRRLRAAGRARRRADLAQRRRPGGQPGRPDRPHRRAPDRGRVAGRPDRRGCSRRTPSSGRATPGPGASAPTRPSTCARLELSTGFGAVSGPGLRITVSDDPDQSADGRVRATRPAPAGQRAVGRRRRGDRDQRPAAHRPARAIAQLQRRHPGQQRARSPRRTSSRRSATPDPAGDPPRRLHDRAGSSSRWPTSSGSWSSGRMRPSSSSRRAGPPASAAVRRTGRPGTTRATRRTLP